MKSFLTLNCIKEEEDIKLGDKLISVDKNDNSFIEVQGICDKSLYPYYEVFYRNGLVVKFSECENVYYYDKKKKNINCRNIVNIFNDKDYDRYILPHLTINFGNNRYKQGLINNCYLIGIILGLYNEGIIETNIIRIERNKYSIIDHIENLFSVKRCRYKDYIQFKYPSDRFLSIDDVIDERFISNDNITIDQSNLIYSILKSSKRNRLEFLRGIMDLYGYNLYNEYSRIMIPSYRDYSFLLYIQKILSSLGIFSGLKLNRYNENTFSIEIYDNFKIIMDLYHNEYKKRECYKIFLTENSENRNKRYNNYIIDIKKYDDKVPYYQFYTDSKTGLCFDSDFIIRETN